jgi:glycosyltransferase involved in cell wall biosynthesis
MAKPILSIITVNLNNSNGLQNTIHSVISQGFAEFEYIIIDGGSTDGSREIIKRYSDYVAYWCSEDDEGIYHAMNKGILKASGDYLQFLNSGDVLTNPEILSLIFSHPRTADIVYGDIDYVYPGGLRKRYYSLREHQLTMANFFEKTIAHPAAFIKRALFAAGLFDVKLRIVADNKFFYERVIFQNCSVQCLDMVIADFDTSGISSQKENWVKTNEERSMVIKQLLPPRILKDYDMMLMMLHSPLLKFMPILNRSTGFQKLVSRVVGIMVWVYSIIRFRKPPHF